MSVSETNSSFLLVLLLEIPSGKTARTDSIAFCDSFGHGDIEARRTFHSQAAGVIEKPSSLKALEFSDFATQEAA